MKYLKLFESFKEEDIDSICRKFDIENYTINKDGTIDVRGGVILSNKGLTELPLRFRKVRGNFFCSENELTSLEGSPQSVGGSFFCSNNKLKSLEGCPKSVGDSFYCSSNQLTTLEGGPQSVKSFICGDNKLIKLNGSPKKCDQFICPGNELTTLEGGPEEVSNFICYENKLKSLKGFPKKINKFNFEKNPCYLIYKDWILTDEENRYMLFDLMEDYDFLRGDTINWYLLEAFFNDSGLEIPNRKELQKYYTIED